MEPRRILVTGSRDWVDRLTIARELVRYISETSVLLTDSQGLPVDWDTQGWTIIHGDCPTGADAWADEFAIGNFIAVERHHADWREHGKRAGFLRNEEMVDAGADICLAFINPCTSEKCRHPKPHGSHGTVDTIRKAHWAGIEVRIFTEVDPDPWWVQRLRKEFT
jgi:YspA, cpYpsA-related SLOG family